MRSLIIYRPKVYGSKAFYRTIRSSGTISPSLNWEPIYLEYSLLDADGQPIVPADVHIQHPTSDVTDAAIHLDEVAPAEKERRESVVVPAGTSAAYGWNEDE